MKCWFLDYIQHLIICQAGHSTWTPFTTSLQPKKWNAHFWIMFNFWWLARLVNGFEPYPPPLYSQKMKCSFLDYVQFLMIGMAGWWIWTPFTTTLQPNKWNAHFWIMFNIWWWAGLINGLKSHLPSFSSQNNEMLLFGLCSTSNDQPGWSIALNLIHHLSPAKIMKCSFLDYFQLLMISRVAWWTQTPSITSLQPKKMKCSFLDCVQLLMIG